MPTKWEQNCLVMVTTLFVLEKPQYETDCFHGPIFYQLLAHFGRKDTDTHEKKSKFNRTYKALANRVYARNSEEG